MWKNLSSVNATYINLVWSGNQDSLSKWSWPLHLCQQCQWDHLRTLLLWWGSPWSSPHLPSLQSRNVFLQRWPLYTEYPDGMKAVLDVCPPGEMNRCLCHDNSKVKFPFDYRTFFLDCRPKRVSSNASVWFMLMISLAFSCSANVMGITRWRKWQRWDAKIVALHSVQDLGPYTVKTAPCLTDHIFSNTCSRAARGVSARMV